jgi:DNA polymerase-3 subunit gamma/tau
MSYLVLARKYRPRLFADVVGQEVVTGTLRGAIAEGRIGHAYLFCGPRGTGKTTTARIFAKALNCVNGPTPDPCGVCERCVAADDGSEVDIIEVDAASHTGVDYVREMREQAAYMPLRARFKIYLIDEVHMLSKGAFNALLKTLEEPPPHVKFLFATTELERLPETIVSRCQLLRLAPLSERTIVDRLSAVFAAEGVKAAPGVAAGIARRARGGMRDALSLADQLLSLCGNELEVADLAHLADSGGADELDRLLDAIEAGAKAELLTSLPATEGGEVELTAALLDHLRATLIVHVCGEKTPLLEVEPAVRERMKARAEKLGVERLQTWLEELLQARERMRLVPTHARLILEVTLLDLARPETSLSLAELAARLAALEERLGSDAALAEPATRTRSEDSTRARNDGAAKPPSDDPGRAREVNTRTRGDQPTRDRGEHTARAGSGENTRASDETSRSHSDVAATARASSAERGTLQPRRPPETARGDAIDRDAGSALRVERASAVGAKDAWSRCLDALRKELPALADLLKQRAELGDTSGDRCVVKLAHIDDDERLLISEPRNVRACSQTLSKALGRPVEIAFEAAQPAPRAKPDAFTTRVSDLFGGRIEDDL